MGNPTFSVVINTYNRVDSLGLTLSSLEQLDYPDFEVVVVNGPSTDDTEALLERYRGRIKVASCPDRNLSHSRNLGIRLAAGDLVAFIDDDAYPDPGWLDALAAAYEDSEVAAAGGPVFNFTGYDIQAWSSMSDRLGNARVEWAPGADLVPLVTSPASDLIPYTIGTNASFRRDLLVGIGGFDEEFEYYLDETDVCRRIVDIGYVVRPLDRGFVYHKFLPSHVRQHPDAVKDHYHVLKSKFYFALKHGPGRKSFAQICRDVDDWVRVRTEHVEQAIAAGLLDARDRQKFEADVHAASDAALEAFLRGRPRTRDSSWFRSVPSPFLPFATLRPAAEKLHVCLLTQEYPPGHVNGIGRVVHSLARGLANRGHVVRVLTSNDGYPTVDLEDGIWVHRLPLVAHQPPPSPEVPGHIWDFAATLADELDRIDVIRPVDVVQAPNWDSQAVAVELAGRFPTVIGLYTPLATLIRTDPVFMEAYAGGDPQLQALVELERWCYQRAAGFLAATTSVITEIEEQYGISLADTPAAIVPHGLADVAPPAHPARWPGLVNVLFVGRLEARKGVDLLLSCVARLAEAHPDLRFTMAGDFTPAGPGGLSHRQFFEQSSPRWRGRVQFTGVVDDEMLWRLYAGCDVVIVPSRYESFGLTALEAMIMGKPVVAADVGGLRSVVADGETGVLFPVDDAEGLAAAIERLVASPELRQKMGASGRRRYEEQFSVDAMVRRAEDFYLTLLPAGRGTPFPVLATSPGGPNR